MLKIRNNLKRSVLGAVVCATMTMAVGSAQAANTPFQQDVSAAIDRAIEFLANQGVYNNPSSEGNFGANGLAMQALLEKRASGDLSSPPQGYVGATPTDQGRLRTAAAFILDRANETSFYAYVDGQWIFALSGYALTSGPDKSALGAGIAGNADYETIKQAMDRMVDRTLANQRKASNGYPNPANQGYWCYTNAGCEDSSTTQFAAAGLHAAKTFYTSAKSGDGGPFADAARAALIDAALARTKTAYALNGGTGSDNPNCAAVTPTERGHGYSSPAEGYKPSLQQTASGIYIQLFGGSDVNTPAVQNYMEWVRNHYRWQDLDNLGNFWPSESWGYYLWSSFKAMELIRQSGVVTAVGNLGPDSFGKLAGVAGCAVRQQNKVPASYARVPSFGAGAVGYYAAELAGQYFDYAHQIISAQRYDGSLPINGNDGKFNVSVPGAPSPTSGWQGGADAAHQSYLLLVLQRSVGNVIQKCDVDGDGDVDTADLQAIRLKIGTVPAANDPRDANGDGKINIADVRSCSQVCTKASCAP